ncbi:MAG: carbon-nitrogen hydrolase family protein [Pirellulales bacterium]
MSVPSQPGQVEHNLELLDAATERAAAAGAQLVLFPELSLSGFIPNHPRGDHEVWLRQALLVARRAALPLESDPVRRLAAIVARHRALICAGMLEDAGNVLYNTQLLVGPTGTLGHWRKMHVPIFEMPFYNPGPGPCVVETPLARIGVNICFDVLLPESTRLLAVQNVEIALLPFAADPPPRTPAGWAAWAGPAIRARAMENGIYCVASNYVGRVECAGVEQEFPGGSLIVSPRGAALAENVNDATPGDMAIATLTAADLQAARAEPEYLFRFRRPELYGPLAERCPSRPERL